MDRMSAGSGLVRVCCVIRSIRGSLIFNPSCLRVRTHQSSGGTSHEGTKPRRGQSMTAHDEVDGSSVADGEGNQAC